MPLETIDLVRRVWHEVCCGLSAGSTEMRKAAGRTLLKRLALISFTAGLSVSSIASGATTTSAAAVIIQRSVEANTRDWTLQTNFSHVERDVKNKLDADGHIQSSGSKTFQILMIDGSPYSRLVAINKEPLSRAQQQSEQAKLDREIAARRSASASDRRARINKYKQDRADEHLLMQQMAAAFDFEQVGEEQIEGVACYLFKATPKPDYNPPVQKARVLKGMQGQMWIDKQQYHWVKVEAEVTEPVSFGFFIAKVNPGTRFELEQAKFGGFWLPQHFSQTVRASVLGLYGFRSQDETFYSDYRPSKAGTTETASVR